MPDGLYDRDIVVWSEQQADLLRRLAAGERVNADVDWVNLIDEVADVGRSELNACESLLGQALVHLLKLQAFATHEAARHWRRETIVFLNSARRRFTPSMKSRIDLAGLHRDAVDAVRAAHPEVAFRCAEASPFTLDELIGRTGPVAYLLGDRGGD